MHFQIISNLIVLHIYWLITAILKYIDLLKITMEDWRCMLNYKGQSCNKDSYIFLISQHNNLFSVDNWVSNFNCIFKCSNALFKTQYHNLEAFYYRKLRKSFLFSNEQLYLISVNSNLTAWTEITSPARHELFCANWQW